MIPQQRQNDFYKLINDEIESQELIDKIQNEYDYAVRQHNEAQNRADHLLSKLKRVAELAQLDTMGLFRNEVELQKMKDILEPFMPIR